MTTGTALPVYPSKATPEQKERNRIIMRDQLKHVVTAPREQQIMMTCPCGHRAVIWALYRCLYCGIFFCKTCAQEHFGYSIPNEYSRNEQVTMTELNAVQKNTAPDFIIPTAVNPNLSAFLEQVKTEIDNNLGIPTCRHEYELSTEICGKCGKQS